MSLQAEFPANALVHFSLASSSDLVHWTPLALRGPLFRFEGENAPANQTLELAQPYKPEGRYLRLSWDAQANVQVKGFTGTLAPAWVAPSPVRASLPPGILDGTTSITWPIDFATPLAALHLTSSRPNTLVPVKILGRNDSSQPWRLLGQTVVYRVGSAGQETSNPPVALGYPSVRWLRVEATNGMTLPVSDLQASVEFAPIELVFLASGKPPFELALGRAHTPGQRRGAVHADASGQGQAGRLTPRHPHRHSPDSPCRKRWPPPACAAGGHRAAQRDAVGGAAGGCAGAGAGGLCPDAAVVSETGANGGSCGWHRSKRQELKAWRISVSDGMI